MPKPPLNFTRVEALRKHMLLTVKDMAHILGASRMTYYKWVGGNPIRPSNAERVHKRVRLLLVVLAQYDWPAPEIIAMAQKDRVARLHEYMEAAKTNKPEAAPVVASE